MMNFLRKTPTDKFVLGLLTIAWTCTAFSQQAAQVFEPGTVSTGKEFTLTFLPGGKEAYFTRYDVAEKRSHIFETVLIDGHWQEAKEISFSDPQYSDLDPCISPDGKHLFFISTRPRPNGMNSTLLPNMDIWIADRVGLGWAGPHWVEKVNSDGKEGSPAVAKDGTLYFFSDRGSQPNSNSIYVSKFNHGKYQLPKRLPEEINAGPSDTSPSISPDGKLLLFYSTRSGGYGKADVYISLKKKGHWTKSRNLGPLVNTTDSEYNPSLSPDGSTLYFGRNGNIYFLSASHVQLK
jgi:Tol biopolymer transport system component